MPETGPIRLLFLDVDGTMTDGVIGFDREGDSRNFWIRDGLALEWARDLDVLPVVISGRASKAVEARCRELGLEAHLNVKDKVAMAETILAREGVAWQQCAMLGDDLPDVALLRRVGWPFAVADASPETCEVAIVLKHAGGRGAVREVVEGILRHNGTWDQVLRRYQVIA